MRQNVAEVSTISVVIATYGTNEWSRLAYDRALPSAETQDADEVRVAHDQDGTCATSRNRGASDASGDWLLFLDADDEFAPGYVGAMRRALERAAPTALLTPAV